MPLQLGQHRLGQLCGCLIPFCSMTPDSSIGRGAEDAAEPILLLFIGFQAIGAGLSGS